MPRLWNCCRYETARFVLIAGSLSQNVHPYGSSAQRSKSDHVTLLHFHKPGHIFHKVPLIYGSCLQRLPLELRAETCREGKRGLVIREETSSLSVPPSLREWQGVKVSNSYTPMVLLSWVDIFKNHPTSVEVLPPSLHLGCHETDGGIKRPCPLPRVSRPSSGRCPKVPPLSRHMPLRPRGLEPSCPGSGTAVGMRQPGSFY